jgi:acyl carrier protein
VAMSEWRTQMTSICAEILSRPTVGPDDDLIALGMDSVAAVAIVNRVESAYGVDVVDVIFDTPTVNHLCTAVRTSREVEGPHGTG